jgi:hypothetical protein
MQTLHSVLRLLHVFESDSGDSSNFSTWNKLLLSNGLHLPGCNVHFLRSPLNEACVGVGVESHASMVT